MKTDGPVGHNFKKGWALCYKGGRFPKVAHFWRGSTNGLSRLYSSCGLTTVRIALLKRGTWTQCKKCLKSEGDSDD